MKIIIGTDHAGYTLKYELVNKLKEKGYDVTDAGAFSTESCDYVDFAEEVAANVANGNAYRGILICTTGIGMAIAANKVPGIRAALVVNTETAKLTREHNDSNILVLPGMYMNADEAMRIAQIWLNTEFSNIDRHIRRLNKIKELENKHLK